LELEEKKCIAPDSGEALDIVYRGCEIAITGLTSPVHISPHCRINGQEDTGRRVGEVNQTKSDDAGSEKEQSIHAEEKRPFVDIRERRGN